MHETYKWAKNKYWANGKRPKRDNDVVIRLIIKLPLEHIPDAVAEQNRYERMFLDNGIPMQEENYERDINGIIEKREFPVPFSGEYIRYCDTILISLPRCLKLSQFEKTPLEQEIIQTIEHEMLHKLIRDNLPSGWKKTTRTVDYEEELIRKLVGQPSQYEAPK